MYQAGSAPAQYIPVGTTAEGEQETILLGAPQGT